VLTQRPKIPSAPYLLATRLLPKGLSSGDGSPARSRSAYARASAATPYRSAPIPLQLMQHLASTVDYTVLVDLFAQLDIPAGIESCNCCGTR